METVAALLDGFAGVVRWCWVKLQCWGVLLIWMRVGQGHTTLAVGAGGFVFFFDIFFSRLSIFFLPLSGRRADID